MHGVYGRGVDTVDAREVAFNAPMGPLPLLALLFSLCLAPAAGGEKPVPPPAATLALSSAPDAAAAKSIEAFASALFAQIASGSPEEVKEARKTAMAVLRKPECTLVFYNAFLQASRASLDPILQSGDGYRATNALFVVRHVRSPEAAMLMLGQCNPATQKSASVRIAAGSMLAAMITGKGVPPAESDRVARGIRENVEAEAALPATASSSTSAALAATRSVECLAALVAAADEAKMAAQARGALNELITAAKAAANRAGEPGGEDFAAAAFRALIGIRDQCVKMSQADQKAMGGNAALKELLTKVNGLQIPASGRTADAARELASARAVADALSAMVGLSKPQPAKK